MQTTVTTPETLARTALPYRAWLPLARRLVATAWYPLALAAAVLILYAPSLGYPIHWDDPTWYAQGRGLSFLEMLRPVPTYQFYRPLTMYVAQALTTPEGVIRVVPAHALQIATHLATALCVLTLLRRVGLGTWPARLGALVFALHPFLFQAVAWQGAHQPLSTLAAMLSILAAAAYAAAPAGARGRGWYLAGSLAAYAAGLLLQESGLPLVWVFGWIALTTPQDPSLGPVWRADAWRGRTWPLGHLALAGTYAVIWLSIPRSQEITGQGFQPVVLAYLLQGVALPLGWPLAEAGAATWPAGWVLAAMAGGAALLAWAAAKGSSLRVAILGALWVASGVAPVWVGLGWEYVSVGPRLFYASAPGVAILWAGASGLVAGRGPGAGYGRAGRAVATALVVVWPLAVCLRDGLDLQRLAEAAFAHQSQAIEAMAARPGERLLFLNYPDRLEVRDRPYPLGFWGLVLAPVAQDLADFALAGAGVRVQTESLSAAEHGWDAREASPYRVDLRGVQFDHESLRAAATWADGAYLTAYAPDGTMRLVEVGHIALDEDAPPLAAIGEHLELVGAETMACAGDDALGLRLVWRLREPGEWGETLFVHLLDEEGRWAAGADGDALGGLLPLVGWPTDGRLVVDERQIDAAGLAPGSYRVTVGAYNRDSGERYPATDATGAPIAAGEVTVATVVLR
jgi:hypothetical protein